MLGLDNNLDAMLATLGDVLSFFLPAIVNGFCLGKLLTLQNYKKFISNSPGVVINIIDKALVIHLVIFVALVVVLGIVIGYMIVYI